MSRDFPPVTKREGQEFNARCSGLVGELDRCTE